VRDPKTIELRVGCAIFAPSKASAETKDEWIALGAGIHDAFRLLHFSRNPYWPRRQEKHHADPNGLKVTYYNGTKPPYPCVVDGVMIFANDCCRLPCAPDRSFRRVERRGISAWSLNLSIRKQLSQSYTSDPRINEYRSEPGIDARYLIHYEVAAPPATQLNGSLTPARSASSCSVTCTCWTTR
jgi:hypothetical protein